MHRTLICGAVTTCVAIACTSTVVRPLALTPGPRLICIKENPKVRVADFVPVVREALSRHGIASEVFSEEAPARCEIVLTYTARRSWDFSPYLSQAEVRLERGGREIGYAEYHLRGKGGLSLHKWQSTREKMDPVLDELRAQVGP